MKTIFLFFLLLFGTVSVWASKEGKSNEAVIFMYHRFGEDRYASTNIRLDQFAFELEYLAKHSYNVWPLSKIIRYMQNGKKLPPKTVALTMDDAYKSVYTNAYPLLKEKGFPFTVFVNTDPVDKHYGAFMTWEQMRQMQHFGAEFANHTSHHISFVSFVNLPPKVMRRKIKEQIMQAQQRLQEELGTTCNSDPKMLAYPFGEYTKEIADVVKEVGFTAVAQVPGVFSSMTPLQEIPRYPMSERFAGKKGFLLKLHTHAMPLKHLPDASHLIKHNPPKLQLELAYPLFGVNCFTSSGERLWMQRKGATTLVIKAKKPLHPPRDHYTCTAKAKDGRWYWYSFFFVFPKSAN